MYFKTGNLLNETKTSAGHPDWNYQVYRHWQVQLIVKLINKLVNFATFTDLQWPEKQKIFKNSLVTSAL